MERTHFDIPGKALPPGMARWPFSDAVRAGDTLYVSGRLGLDPQTRRPPADVSDEARCLMDDLQRVLSVAEMTVDDLVMVTIFAPDVANFAAFNAVYVSYFNGPCRPARSSARDRSSSAPASSSPQSRSRTRSFQRSSGGPARSS